MYTIDHRYCFLQVILALLELAIVGSKSIDPLRLVRIDLDCILALHGYMRIGLFMVLALVGLDKIFASGGSEYHSGLRTLNKA